MEDFGDDAITFAELDAELGRINEKFEKGQMRAFGQEQEAIMKSFAEIRKKNEALATALAALRQNQLLQGGNETEDMPWSDNVLDKEFQVKTVSLALDRASLKRVNNSLNDVFTSMEAVTTQARSVGPSVPEPSSKPHS
jgi:putative IMPACT (imprinted ancient) family translation regulator